MKTSVQLTKNHKGCHQLNVSIDGRCIVEALLDFEEPTKHEMAKAWKFALLFHQVTTEQLEETLNKGETEYELSC